MGWVEVPCLLEGRDQMNHRFPNRDKSSEGTIGDQAHAVEASSHNPDLTGHPEYRDGDKIDEVRAIDFDKDLRDPSGATMENLVQIWIKAARAGKMSWVRYFIYNGRIWHRKDGFLTHKYTGSNKHTDHCHVNSDFTQAADTIKGTDWLLGDPAKPTPPAPKPPTPSPKTPVMKKGDSGETVRQVQRFFLAVFPAYRDRVSVRRGVTMVVDGYFGDQTEAWVRVFQSSTGIGIDGMIGPVTLAKMREYGYQH